MVKVRFNHKMVPTISLSYTHTRITIFSIYYINEVSCIVEFSLHITLLYIRQKTIFMRLFLILKEITISHFSFSATSTLNHIILSINVKHYKLRRTKFDKFILYEGDISCETGHLSISLRFVSTLAPNYSFIYPREDFKCNKLRVQSRGDTFI
jgi:hypothetical protein